MSYLVYAYTLLTILAFVLAVKINQRWKSVVLNSFVLTVLMLVAVLLVFHLPYDNYMVGNAPLNNLLGVSIVALAVPLYEQLRQISRHWQIILITTVSASLLAMFSGAVLALLLGAKPDIYRNPLPHRLPWQYLKIWAGFLPLLRWVSLLQVCKDRFLVIYS